MDEVIDDVLLEMKKAHDRYGFFTSTHEGFGVLAEEVMELLHAIHLNDMDAIRGEAIHVAAVACRVADGCGNIHLRNRSVK